MELGLEIIKTRVNLYSIRQRIKASREQILKTKPEATDYIQGAELSEQELLEAVSFFSRLHEHAVAMSRENSILANRNIDLQLRVKELENEIKINQFEL